MYRNTADRFFFKHNYFPKRSKRAEKDSEKSDSIWAVVYNTAKNLGVSPDYVLNEMSYLNVLMYNSATPSYDIECSKTNEVEWTAEMDRIDANNPSNFKTENDETEIFV